jgi:hypothetical protein
LASPKQQLSALTGTQWIVAAGIIAGLAVLSASLANGATFVTSFFLALVADVSVIGLAGVSRRMWQGAEVSGVSGPAGTGLDLEAAQTVQKGLEDLNKRVDAHTETVNKRLYDLEKTVFKGANEGTDEKE